MSRIQARMAANAGTGRKALVPYLVAGDPQKNITVPFMHELVSLGADIIELGVPFSDPMAEGPTIQRGHERALEHRTGLRDVLAMVTEFRRDNADTPIVLMGYANPIEAMGYQTFATLAQEAGVDGVLTVDLPPEEAQDLHSALQAKQIDSIFLLAPTSHAGRIAQVAKLATGYVYYVSLKGVTGAGTLNVDEVAVKVAEIREQVSIPLCVGFGIKDADSAQQIGRLCDGVVVGSAIVDLMGQGDVGLQQAGSLFAEIRAGLDR